MTEANEQQQATILVIDDHPDNLTLLNSLLRDEYKVKVANSGERGLKIAQSGIPPDLILLDIMMPKMDGYEVCQHLKLEPATCDIPVIFLTAKWEIEDEQRGLELGAVDYIMKPISPPILLARVKNHLAVKTTADVLREKNRLLLQTVQKRDEEIMGIKTGVYVHEVDMAELNTVVFRLATLLAEQNSESILYLEKHQPLLEEVFLTEFITRLRLAIQNHDFANALAMLTEIAAEWQISW